MLLDNTGALIENNYRYKFLQNYFEKNKHSGTLLDLGCGPRPYYDIYKNYFEKTIGADIADLPFPKKGIDIYCTATDVPLPDASVDFILCTEVLQDILEPNDLMKEVNRLLKPGGTMILTTPYLVPIADGKWDNYRFTQYGLDYQLKKGNFDVQLIHPVSDVVGAGITLLVKPMQRFWNVISKASKLKFLTKWYNPFVFLTIILPQLSYMMLVQLPVFKQLLKKFNYGPIGYITVSFKR
jgi:ubiquinone/menaquinone biosynthesis C-methylase UbiE